MPEAYDRSTLRTVDLRRFDDDRGYFLGSPIEAGWTQENLSLSKRGVLRGMHFQLGASAQTKQVRALTGKAVDVVLDMRKESPTFRQAFSFLLDPAKPQYVLVPKGFAHAFVALEDNTLFQYRIDASYDPSSERSVHWKSCEALFLEALKIHGLSERDLILAKKDAEAPMFEDWFKLGEPVTGEERVTATA